MKKILSTIVLLSTLFLTGCFEDINKTYNGPTVVEFNQAVIAAPAVGATYPLVSVNRGVGLQTTRINLVGAQRPNAETIKVSIDPATTATDGTHFKIVTSSVTIPANSSFGDFQIDILAAPAQAGKTVNVVLVLEGNGADIKPNENFKKLGFAIRL